MSIMPHICACLFYVADLLFKQFAVTVTVRYFHNQLYASASVETPGVMTETY